MKPFPSSSFNMALFSEFLASLNESNLLRSSASLPSLLMLSSLVLFLWLLLRLTAQGKNKSRLRLPPGPFPWPIIGNLNQLKNLPHCDLHELSKKYGPIMMLKFGSFPTVVVSSSAMAKEVFKTHDLVFANRPPAAAGKYLGYNFRDVAFSNYNPHWRHMRKLCVVGLLSPKRVESFRSVREEDAFLFVRSLWEISGQGKTPVNLTQMLSTYSLGNMWRMLSGHKYSFHSVDDRCDDHDRGAEMRKMTLEAMVALGEVNIGDLIPYLDWMDLQGAKRRLEKVQKCLNQLITRIIEEHQQRRRKIGEEHDEPSTWCFIDELLELQSLDGREITEENIKAIVFDLLLAGVETTATTLGWLMSSLIKNPNVAKKMQEEIESVVGRDRMVNEDDVAGMEYVQCVVKESLRLHPVTPLLVPHESSEDCTVGGYFIPARSRLIINSWAIGRDPSVWEDPLVFRPERFMGRDVDLLRNKDFFDMLPFGAGRRGCPGANMASVSINFLSAQLFHCFDWSVEGDLDMTVGAPPLFRSVDLVALPRFRLNTCL